MDASIGPCTPSCTPLELLENTLELGEEALAAGDLKEAARAAQVGQSCATEQRPAVAQRSRAPATTRPPNRPRTAADAAEAKLKKEPLPNVLHHRTLREAKARCLRAHKAARAGDGRSAALYDRWLFHTLMAVADQPDEVVAATMFMRLAVALEVTTDMKGWPDGVVHGFARPSLTGKATLLREGAIEGNAEGFRTVLQRGMAGAQ